MMLLNNRVVLITGASRGIGAATAKLLGQQGAAVGVNYYNSAALAQQVVDEIQANGGKALAVQADARVASATNIRGIRVDYGGFPNALCLNYDSEARHHPLTCYAAATPIQRTNHYP